MSWPLFAVIQLALIAVGVGVVFWLRTRELKARLLAAEQATAEAETLVEEAAMRFETVSTEALDKWLVERAEALDEGDPVQLVQKRVLQNERQPIADFAEDMQRRLTAGNEARERGQDQWRELRTASYELACGLIERFPRSHPVLVQLFDAFSSLDSEYDLDLPALPEPAAMDADDESGGSEEIEHLNAANELLRQQLEELQKALDGLRSSGNQAQAQEEDLKTLLQQFTRDSRDMMCCIQELEQENQRLRERLGQEPDAAEASTTDGAAAAATTTASDEVSAGNQDAGANAVDEQANHAA